MSANEAAAPTLEIVICTYNRAADLDRCLGALAAQRVRPVGWRVTVVDNNCTDATSEVVEAYIASGNLMRLQRIMEPRQGLTPARLRGVRETLADWVAFIDDDCIADPDWVAEALTFATAYPESGAFGGRVVPDWGEAPLRHAARNAWLYAAQDHGDETCLVKSLVGAGIVLNRRALAATGWTQAPLIADRVGRGTVSGGDVELILRLAAAGRPLFYVPGMRIAHRIPKMRQRMRNALALARGLGAGSELINLMADPDPQGWADRSGARLAAKTWRHIAGLRHVVAIRYPLRDWLIFAAFLLGQHEGRRALVTDPVTRARIGGRGALLSKALQSTRQVKNAR